MAKNIIIFILIAVCSFMVTWRITAPRADTSGIDNLKRTIESYRETVERLETENRRLAESISELSEYRDRLIEGNKRLEVTIGELQEIISGANSNISDAIETTERIRKLSEQIEN